MGSEKEIELDGEIMKGSKRKKISCILKIKPKGIIIGTKFE